MPASHRDALRAGGIVVEPFRPIRLSTLHLAQHRSHVRGIVIDSRVGWTGGFGIDDKWFGDGRTNGSWRETNVRFEGPAVRQLQAAFVAAWVEATGVMLTGHATLSPQENGVAAAGVVVHGSHARKHCCRTILRAVHRWRPKDAVHHQLVLRPGAQLHRPVGRRSETRGGCAYPDGGPRTDVNIVRNAGRAWYDTLLDGRRPRVRMAAVDAPREDIRGRRAVVHDRIDELRQSIDGAERRIDADGPRFDASASRWIRSFWTIFDTPKRSPSPHSSNGRGGHG